MEDHPPEEFEEEKKASKPFKINEKNLQSSQKKSIDNPQKQPRASADNEDLSKIINSIQKQHDELQEKLDTLYEQRTLSGQKIKEYIEDPNNFTPSQWEKIQKQRKMKKDQFLDSLGTKTKEKILKQEDTQSAKERKGKTISSRKKWLQM